MAPAMAPASSMCVKPGFPNDVPVLTAPHRACRRAQLGVSQQALLQQKQETDLALALSLQEAEWQKEERHAGAEQV